MRDPREWGRKELESIKPYVPGKPIEEVERELGIKGVIKLAANENPLGPSPKVVEALQKSASQAYLYPDGNCFYLKERLAAFLDVSLPGIIIGNGSDEILKLITEAFIYPGEKAVIPHPSFSEYIFATTLMGGECSFIELCDYRHDLEAMGKAISENTKIVFICNPNNPTGTIVYQDEVLNFLQYVPEDCLVVFDEAYYEYVDDRRFPQTLDLIREGRKNIIVLRTFSKIYGLAGLRIGYGVAHPDLISWISRAKEPFNVNRLAQIASLVALDDAWHVEESRRVNQEGRLFLESWFSENNLFYVPTQANFILVDVQRDSREVFQEMLKKGVIVRSADIFGLDRFLRVTVGTREQNERFCRALEEVLK